MKTDSLFYLIFTLWPELIFKLANIQQSAKGYSFTSEELKQVSKRIDGVLKPPDANTTAPITLVEIQIQKDDQLYARLFNELFMYLRQHDPENPWQIVVIYPSKTQESQHHIHHYKGLLVLPNVHIIYLKELLKTLPDTPGLSFLKLIMATQLQAKKLARDLLRNRKDWSERYGLKTADYLELVETIIVYKFSQMTREEIRIMLNLPNIDLKDTRFYKDVYAEGRHDGLSKGRQEEYERNRRSEIVLLKHLLTRTLGKLPKTVTQRLDRLSLDDAHTLLGALLDFDTMKDLQHWLQQNKSH